MTTGSSTSACPGHESALSTGSGEQPAVVQWLDVQREGVVWRHVERPCVLFSRLWCGLLSRTCGMLTLCPTRREIRSTWKAMQLTAESRVRSMPVPLTFLLGTDLCNVRTCLRGSNQVARHFRLAPPALDEYIAPRKCVYPVPWVCVGGAGPLQGLWAHRLQQECGTWDTTWTLCYVLCSCDHVRLPVARLQQVSGGPSSSGCR
jgi:hypothetical protein